VGDSFLIANDNQIVFPKPEGDWGWARSVAITDQDGIELFASGLSTPKYIEEGDSIVIEPRAIGISIS
jgi:hypothetical protein